MHIDAPLLNARFIKRYKRFFADVELEDGSTLTAHCPNTGSLKGCLEEGAPVWLRDSQNPKRKLRYTWQAICLDGQWVNVDTGMPNQTVFEAAQAGEIPSLRNFDSYKREVKYGTNSRIDVLCEKEGELCYVEVKNTTLARGKTALFPDAVTERGRKHLGELSKMVAEGHRAVQFFFVSRDDVTSFRPAEDIDPAYAAALREAAAAGVEIVAYSSIAKTDSLELNRKLRVELGSDATVS